MADRGPQFFSHVYADDRQTQPGDVKSVLTSTQPASSTAPENLPSDAIRTTAGCGLSMSQGAGWGVDR